MATQQTMGKDLRTLLSALKISNDLERVGDHAANIAGSAKRLAESTPIAPKPELLEMARLAREENESLKARLEALERAVGKTS